MTWDTAIALIGAVTGFVSAIAALVAASRSGKVHSDISTGNGRSIGQTIAGGTSLIRQIAREVVPESTGALPPSTEIPSDPSDVPSSAMSSPGNSSEKPPGEAPPSLLPSPTSTPGTTSV